MSGIPTSAATARSAGLPFISKSKFLAGLQCDRLLWTLYNAKEQLPPIDEATQAVFDQGKEVGDLAKQLCPDGIEVGVGITNLKQTIQLSLQAVRLRRPMFEAAFEYQGAYARADIMDPVGKDRWDIIEVKSSTQVKEVNLHDVALQRYVYSGAGLKIRRCFVLHINGDYVRKGEVDPEKFFTKTDVTAEVRSLSTSIPDQLRRMFATIQLKQCPEDRIGPHCSDPYVCALQDSCWSFLPEHSVFSLRRGGKKAYELFDLGILKIADIPEAMELNEAQTVQRRTITTGEPHVEKAAISRFLKKLKYPVSYLDFETFGTAIPLFDNSKPYQQIPFQFSLHIVRREGAVPEHHSFLAEGRQDPRPAFVARLKELLPGKGSIVAYNASFESNVLSACCQVHKEYLKWFRKLKPRIVDLLVPFRNLHYYHPEQDGSASMKAVLPALTGKDYSHLDIQEGGSASREFLRVTFTGVSQQERQKVRNDLEKYCGLDTEGMIWIVEKLKRAVT